MKEAKRQVVLDTETTGLDPEQGHRIVEIGCVELIDGVRTQNFYHRYINPERDMPDEAFRIHGISSEFLSDKQTFADIYEEFMEFLGDAQLVIHNAAFDIKFLKAESKRLGRVFFQEEREVIDTLLIARKKYPGAKANLDALCSRYGINIDHREKHGALLDAELLARVYIEMTGGAQRDMLATIQTSTFKPQRKNPSRLDNQISTKTPRTSRHFPINQDEINRHREFLKKLKYPLWTAVEESS
ncbi:MAG: DNA polymerase III subunit epsilon [Alphaproteobacteria bacterium]|nr:DNA polymerase III subunit epsilon [Alphaproteobacteria bacterium]